VSQGPKPPPTVVQAKVFITYRREETAAHAGRLYDAMVAQYGERNVFMDVELAPGVDFIEQITGAVAACHVLIVVMGPRWATVENEDGTPRIADPDDFVRLEVETALQRPGVTPIPVLVAGARMPNRDDLPVGLRAITRRNALELSDQRWHYDVGRLITTLDELLAETTLASLPAISGLKAAPPASAAPTSGETKPAGGPRRLRWAALGAIAIAAIVAVVVLATRPGDSSPPAASSSSAARSASAPASFATADLQNLVLPTTAPPGDLQPNLTGDPYDKSGPSEGPSGVAQQLGADPDDMPGGSQASYQNVFTARSEHSKPYWYSKSIAVVFADAEAAQRALVVAEANNPGKSIAAQGLGDDQWAVTLPETAPASFKGSWEGNRYLYVWRTGNLLQVFDLVLSGRDVSEATARSFADKMDARTESGT
jgi:hypothetical protein